MTHLEALISSHQNRAAKAGAQQVNWQARRVKWLDALEKLFDRIQRELIFAGVDPNHIQDTHHTITEESLGTYDAPGLLVQIGTGRVTFTPVGSVIIGGYGRVDVYGPRGEVKLIAGDIDPFHDPEQETPSHQREWTWLAYPDKARNGFALDQEGLAKVLELVLGNA